MRYISIKRLKNKIIALKDRVISYYNGGSCNQTYIAKQFYNLGLNSK